MRMCALIVAVLLVSGASSVQARDFDLLALDGSNGLLRFNSARPGDVTTTKISGVDRHPRRPRSIVPRMVLVYALSDANDVYTIERAVGGGDARSVRSPSSFDGGPRSGVDFNPQADRLRLVAASGQNLRVHVDLGATAADGALRYAADDPNAGKRPAIAAAAYTNAVANAATTKLFDIDSDLDVLALQDPPNDGVLRTVGPLGADFGARAGFDIVSAGGVDRAFAVVGRRPLRHRSRDRGGALRSARSVRHRAPISSGSPSCRRRMAIIR